MEIHIQEIVEELSRDVIKEHGFNPEKVNLPPDVKRWVELIHEHLTDDGGDTCQAIHDECLCK